MFNRCVAQSGQQRLAVVLIILRGRVGVGILALLWPFLFCGTETAQGLQNCDRLKANVLDRASESSTNSTR